MGDAVEMDIAERRARFFIDDYFLINYLILKVNKFFLLRFVGEFDGECPTISI